MIETAENEPAFMRQEIQARNFVICALTLVIVLVLSKAVSAYTNTHVTLFVLPLLAGGLLLSRNGLSRWALPATLAVATLAVAAAVANFVPDPTWDGNMYHKPAIVALHDGWNPWVFPEFSDWVKTRPEAYFSAAVWQNNENSTWVSHYPNLSWLLGSALMDFGYGWESGKALSWFLAIALFLYSRAVLMQYVPNRAIAWVISLLVVSCPPLVAQLPTNYVDGPTYAAAALVIFSLLDKDRARCTNAIAWCSLIILAGLKFTGALYAALLAIPFLALRRPYTREILAWALVGAISLSHPYLNHVVSGLDIAYPVTVNDKVLRGQVEQKLLDEPRVFAIATSLFSKTANSLTRPGLKVPGTIHEGEIAASGSPDVRFAGFGPLFSLAFLISLSAAAAAIFTALRKRQFKRREFMLLGASALIVLLTLAHAAPWWARYVPFFYLASVLILTLGVSSAFRIPRTLGVVGLMVLLLNTGLVIRGSAMYVRDYSLRPGIMVDRNLAKNYGRANPIMVRAPEFIAFSAVYHLQESLGFQQVRYEPAPLDALDCANSRDMGLWVGLARICQLERVEAPTTLQGLYRIEALPEQQSAPITLH